MCLGSLRYMKHSLIVQMHPDGVFVFLSLLIYGGLFYTQKKNLHFNFHYLFLSLQHSSSGRELVFCFPPAAPHCSGIGEDTEAGYYRLCSMGTRLMLPSSLVRYTFAYAQQGPQHAWSHPSALPPCCDGGGRQQPCLLPGSQHWPLPAHPFLETAANKRARRTRNAHPSAFSLLQRWQEDKQEALGTGPFLVSCRIVPVIR